MKTCRLLLAAVILLLTDPCYPLLPQVSVSAAIPISDAPHCPFRVQAPWRYGLTWTAGKPGGYYYREGTHNRKDEYALDFNGPNQSEQGDFALAVADGRVEVNSWDGVTCGYGNNVVLSHPWGFKSRYAHLDTILVADGQWVEQGTPIGTIGTTGCVAPHLHFAMYQYKWANGQWTEPISVRPEPLANVPLGSLVNGASVTSSNYRVGYDANWANRFQPILDTYNKLGGRFGAFGMTKGPVYACAYGVSCQEFLAQDIDGYSWSDLGDSAIVVNGGEGYLVGAPIWDEYKRLGGASSWLGLPTNHTYEWREDSQSGYRSDFEHGSIVWLRNGQFNTINADSGWNASFFEEPSFSGIEKRRYDRWVNFDWGYYADPGPVSSLGGFSVRWTRREDSLVSGYRFQVTVQGNVRLKLGTDVIFEHSSPDSVWSGTTEAFYRFGSQDITVEYSQESAKAARIQIGMVTGLIPPAFAAQSLVGPCPQIGYDISYTLCPLPAPPYPGEDPAPPAHDVASFVSDVTLPDGTPVTPGQSMLKTWRVRNTGTSTWDGYELRFVSGDQMGGASSVSIPKTPPGQEVNISVSLKAPASEGSKVGYWQIVNRDGIYVQGGRLLVNVYVVGSTAADHIAAFTADPPSPSKASTVRLYARVNWWPQFRAMRVKVDSQVVGETAATEYTWSWDANSASRGDHTIVLEVADLTDTSWSRPERRVLTYNLQGEPGPVNHAPNRPVPVANPAYNWYVTIGSAPQLCAQASDPDPGDTLQY